MKKVKYLWIIFIWIILCNFATGGLSGVRPAFYEFDFEPNLNLRADFNFVFDAGVESEIYFSDFEGSLAQYASADKEIIIGSEKVAVFLNLPSEVKEPGMHVIRVGARQLASEVQGFGVAADVGGLIRIRVPYPGKYIDLDLEASDANTGEPVRVKLKIYNRGEEGVSISAILVISNEDGEMEHLAFKPYFIESTKNIELFKEIDTSNYPAGNYNLTAIVEYGEEKPAEAKTFFRLGELYVKILDYTKVFEKDKIEKFEIEIENLWNNKIEDVYADINIPEFNISFLTPSVGIRPWEKGILTGFFDTSKIESNRFKANISVYYEGGMTSEIVDLKLRGGMNTLTLIIIGLVIVIIVLMITFFFMLRKYFMNSAKRKK